MSNLYTNREYFHMLIILGLSEGNALDTSALYAERYPNRRNPGVNVIRNLGNRLLQTGSLIPLPKINAGRPP